MFQRGTSLIPEGVSDDGRISQNYDLAFKYIHQAAYGYTKNEPFVWDNYSDTSNNKTSTSKEAFMMLLEKGYPMAIHALGNFHNDPKLTNYYNRTLAFLYYEAAAYLDSPQGHFSYAAMLVNDDSDKDIELGLLHLSRAIALGHLRSMNYLAHAFFDSTSWLHNYVREQRLRQGQRWRNRFKNFSYGDSYRHAELKQSIGSSTRNLRLKSWLNLQANPKKISSYSRPILPRYRVLEVNISEPFVLQIQLPNQHVSLHLQSLVGNKKADSQTNSTGNETYVSYNTETRRNVSDVHVMWKYSSESWCAAMVRLIRHVAEFHPYGTSLATMTNSAMTDFMNDIEGKNAISDGLDFVESEATTESGLGGLANIIVMFDTFDEGAELGYLQMQLNSYKIHRKMFYDVCPSLSDSFYQTDGSNMTADYNLSQNVSTIKSYRNLFDRFVYKYIKKYLIRLLETKFTYSDFQDGISISSAFSVSGDMLQQMPVWITAMTRQQCHRYFEMMMIRRLIQLSSQGHKASKRILAMSILYRSKSLTYENPLQVVPGRSYIREDYNQTLNGSERSFHKQRDLFRQGIYMLVESGNAHDVEALISLGWLVYFDHLGKHLLWHLQYGTNYHDSPLDLNLNKALAPQIFKIAFQYEIGTSTGGLLSNIAFICYYALETARIIRQVVRDIQLSYGSFDGNILSVDSIETFRNDLFLFFHSLIEFLDKSIRSEVLANVEGNDTLENVLLLTLSLLLCWLSYIYILRRRYRRIPDRDITS